MIDLKKLNQDMEPFFRPASVAVVGATNNITKWGSLITGHILSGGFKGKVYPIHPSEPEIHGVTAYPRVSDVPGDVDLVFITLPAAKVPEALCDCAAKRVRAAVVITSDFSETGEEGRLREKEILRIAHEARIRIIGPNTMGLTSTEVDLHAIGAPVTPDPGPIAFVSQSGNLGTQMLYWAAQQGVGIRRFIGSGNEADITLPELLAWLGKDDLSKVILLYMEGVEDGRQFLEVAKQVTGHKPVIALKSGRTSAGSRAASSHTGSLAGQAAVFTGAMKQAGIISVDNPSDLVEMAGAFTHLNPPKGNRLGIVTLGGGWGVVTTDMCSEAGFILPELPTDLAEKFDEWLPPFWSRSNPVDLVGHLDLDIHLQIIEKMIAHDAFDALITLGSLGAADFVQRLVKIADEIQADVDESVKAGLVSMVEEKEMEFQQELLGLMKKYGKPIAAVSLAGTGRMIKELGNGETTVVFPTPEKAVKAMEKLYEYYRISQRDW